MKMNTLSLDTGMIRLALHGLLLHFLMVTLTEGKGNVQYYMPSSSCGMRKREIDGAVIRSSGYSSLYSACIMKFEADDDFFTSKKIMVQFEKVRITNCKVTLKLYDSSSSVATPMRTFTCNRATSFIPAFTTTTKYLTVRLDRPSGVSGGFDFRIILTAVKPRAYCKSDEVKCGFQRCADRDLRCDGIRHCSKGEDEINCQDYGGYVHVGVGAMVGLALAVITICIIAVVVTIICCRRRNGYTGRVLRSGGQSSVTTSTTAVPPPNQGMAAPYPPPQYGVPYQQQPPAYGYPQSPTGYPSAAYPQQPQPNPYPPPAYPGSYPQGTVNYTAGSEEVKVPQQ